MSEHLREKIALIVFVVLVLLAGACLVGYVIAGHSWNVTATNIDDTFGSLDGYTVILYEGTTEVSQQKSKDSSSSENTTESNASTAGTSKDKAESNASAAGASENKAEGKDEKNENEISTDASDSTAESNASAAGASENATGAAGATDANAVAAAAATDTTDKTPIQIFKNHTIKNLRDLKKSEKHSYISAAQVEKSYIDKGAAVLCLDIKNPSIYEEGLILKKGDCRFGVFSIDKPITNLELKRMLSYFKECSVDAVVALVSDRKLLKDAEDIDIVIEKQGESVLPTGETKNGTFYMNATECGSVGAILISPSKVVSGKVIVAEN